MIRLNPRYRPQVPHGLAIVGALLLLAGTVTGVGNGFDPSRIEATAASTRVSGGDMDAVESSRDSTEAIQTSPVKQQKRFKMNLFLFRR